MASRDGTVGSGVGGDGETGEVEDMAEETAARDGAALHSGHILRDSLGYLPASLLPAVFSLIGSAVFTRIFPPVEYGVYTLMGAITGPVLSLTAQPSAQAATRFLAEYDHQGRMGEYRQAVSWLAVITMGIMLVAALMALVLWPLAKSPSVSELALQGALLGLLASILYNILTPVLMAAIQVRAFRQITIVAQALALALPLVLLALLGHHIAWLLWGNALAVILVLPSLVRRANVLHWPKALSADDRSTLKRFWAYGAPMTFWFFSSSMLNVGDRYVVQAYHGTAQVGLYGANYAIAAQGVALLTNPLLNATGPRLLRQWAAGDRDGVIRTMSRMTSVYMLLGIALIGLMATSGYDLVHLLLARAFRPGAAVLVPVLAGAVIWGVSRIGHKSMEFVEKNTLMVWDVLVAAVVNMGLNFLLVPRYGYVAAGYTTLISYFVYTVLVWWQARSLVPWQIPWRDLAGYAIAALLGYLADRALFSSLTWHPAILLVLTAAVYLLIYGGLMVLWFRLRGDNPLMLLRR
jgi:O-antigen/teichoic acid export membrane protein